MKQEEMVLNYIKEKGSITQGEALKWLGVARLASRISDLRRAGYTIERGQKNVRKMDGTITWVAEYRLTAEPSELKKKNAGNGWHLCLEESPKVEGEYLTCTLVGPNKNKIYQVLSFCEGWNNFRVRSTGTVYRGNELYPDAWRIIPKFKDLEGF